MECIKIKHIPFLYSNRKRINLQPCNLLIFHHITNFILTRGMYRGNYLQLLNLIIIHYIYTYLPFIRKTL